MKDYKTLDVIIAVLTIGMMALLIVEIMGS